MIQLRIDKHMLPLVNEGVYGGPRLVMGAGGAVFFVKFWAS